MANSDWVGSSLPRPAYRACAPMLVLLGGLGCSGEVATAPGEKFSAGYVLADRQPKVTHDFTVRNSSAENVKVLEIRKNCGCTSFDLKKRELAPGEATVLTISVDVPHAHMPKFADCVLQTDHPRFKDWVYGVEFVSLPFIVADPPDLSLGLFGVDGTGMNAVKSVDLNAFAGSKTELTRDMFDVPEEISLEVLPDAQFQKLQQDAWSSRYRLSVRLSDKGREAMLHNPRSGVIPKSVNLRASESRRWSYSVYWQMLAPLAAHPSFLSFGDLSDDKGDHSRIVTISSSTKGRFGILSVKSEPPNLLMDAVYDAGREGVSHRITVTPRRPEASKGRFLTGSIQVQTTDRLQPAVEIRWSAILDRLGKDRLRADGPLSPSRPGL
jgi:Protein of unknown function (DUF1573)